MDKAETGEQGYDPMNKPRNPLEAIKRTWRKSKTQSGHLTGRYGYDPDTGLEIVERSNQTVQAAKDLAESEKKSK